MWPPAAPGEDGRVTTTPRPTQTWTTTLSGHRYELDVTPGLSSRLVVRVDGEQLYDKKASDERRTIRLGEGRRLEVRLSGMGSIKRATAHDGAAELDLDAPPGTRAARLQEFGRAHPTLFALRHLAVQGGIVLVAVLGLGVLFSRLVEPVVRWVSERMPRVDLPDIPWPDIDVPDIPWPSIDLPGLPWPTPPAWLIAVFEFVDEYEWIVKPLLLGLVLAVFELRRQRRQRAHRETARTAASAPDPEAGDAGDAPVFVTGDGGDGAGPTGDDARTGRET